MEFAKHSADVAANELHSANSRTFALLLSSIAKAAQ